MRSRSAVRLLLLLLLPVGLYALLSQPPNEASSRDLSLCDQTDDTLPAVCFADRFPRVYDRSRAVARVWMRFEDVLFSHCTAWLLGCEGHVLTNQHCVDSQEMADQLEFEFMAQGTDCSEQCNVGQIPCPGSVHIRTPLTFIQTGSSSDLDYTLLQLPLEYRSLSQTYGYLQLRDSGPVLHERIYVPQHPLGYGKRIALYTNATTNSGAAAILELNVSDYNNCGQNIVTHNADTASGASGSPVLSVEDHKVVAIHHCGGCDEFGKNGAVPSKAIIADLGVNLPKCSV